VSVSGVRIMAEDVEIGSVLKELLSTSFPFK
jgi:hypothetical protein